MAAARRCVWIWVFAAWACPVWGQAASADAVLAEMASRAGAIFAGEVVAVNPGAGIVDVRFRVDDPVFGCGKGFYVLREWAGLWSGSPRYAVGQRFLMLLTARGPSGMSSAVDGMAGAIPLLGTVDPAVVRGGVTPVDKGTGSPVELNGLRADLRWVQARVLRKTTRAAAREEEDWAGPVTAAGAAPVRTYGALAGILRGSR